MCNKISYETKKEAKDHYSFIRRSNGTPSHFKKMRPYLCHVCNKWHLTSMSRSHSKILKRSIKKGVDRVELINKFRALKSNDERWEFIIKHQGNWIEVNIEEDRTYVLFNGRVRVLFD